MSDSEEDWTPPSEAQMKVIQAKRERSDKISKLMGDYLLKGYKMLATSCSVCYTVELQDRSGLKFCVACQEVDSHENSKDDPALSREAAERVVEEQQYTSGHDTGGGHDSGGQYSGDHDSGGQFSGDHDSGGQYSGGHDTSVLRSAQQCAQTPLITRSQSNLSSLSITPGASHNIAPATGARPRSSAPAVSEQVRSDHDHGSQLIRQSVAGVTTVLEQANRDLETCVNTEKMTQLVILVREAATTLVTLRQHLSDPCL